MKRFWYILKTWFSYYKVCKYIYDFDYIDILSVERHQLYRTLECIKKYHYHVNSKHNIFWMQIALNILDRIIDEDLYLDKDFKVTSYVNLATYKKYINIEKENNEFFKRLVYQEKLWYVYNKIRYYYLRKWWE